MKNLFELHKKEVDYLNKIYVNGDCTEAYFQTMQTIATIEQSIEKKLVEMKKRWHFEATQTQAVFEAYGEQGEDLYQQQCREKKAKEQYEQAKETYRKQKYL